MDIRQEISLKNFDFWSGARDTRSYLTDDEMDTIEDILSDESMWIDNIPTDTEINDLFWFEDDIIAEWLGYENFEQIMKERS